MGSKQSGKQREVMVAGSHIAQSLNERVISTRLVGPKARNAKTFDQMSDAEIDRVLERE